jgi:spermidine synthase/MFS family permease
VGKLTSSALAAAVLLSGCSALIYQVVWVRASALHLGASGAAIGTVVATFLGGLAIGAPLGGAIVDRVVRLRGSRSALTVYACLEGFVALCGLAVIPLLGSLASTLGRAYPALGDSLWYGVLRFGVCVVALLPATIAMGATLPALARYAASIQGDFGRVMGRLYSINVGGALLGAFAAGWWLIPHFGLQATSALASGLNLLCILAIFGARGSARTVGRELASQHRGHQMRWILVAYCVSGFAALVFEICWTRGLILAFGSSVYAFSLTLVCFLTGLSIGGLVGSLKRVAAASGPLVFAVMQLASAACAMMACVALLHLPALMMNVTSSASSYVELLVLQALIGGILVTIPAIPLGALFPTCVRMAVPLTDKVGASVGALCAWNTVGNVAGTLAGSFLLLPIIGLPMTVLVGSVIQIAVALYALRLDRRRWAPIVTVAVLCLVVALSLLPTHRLEDITATPAVYAKWYAGESERTGKSVQNLLRESPVVFSEWDATGLVTVHRRGQHLTLRVNGKADASSEADMLPQVLTAHLGLLAHPNPRNVLVVGLGSGATASAALLHPGVDVDVVEISPGVVNAVKEVFSTMMQAPLGDSRAHLHLTDARTHIRYTDKRYDVIAAEPSNLWVSGMSSLFTREHFEAYKDKLRAHGVVCQWVHAYRLPQTCFNAVLATFQSVFPHCTIWEVSPGGDYLLLGCLDPQPVFATMRTNYERNSRVREQLRMWGQEDYGALMGSYVASVGAMGRQLEGIKPVTDDDCYIEYTAPRGLLMDESHLVIGSLELARSQYVSDIEEWSDEREARAELARLTRLARSGRHRDAWFEFEKVTRRRGAPKDLLAKTVADEVWDSTEGEVSTLLRAGRTYEARNILQSVPASAGRAYAQARALLDK